MIVFVSRDFNVISGQRNERKTFINLEDVDDHGLKKIKTNKLEEKKDCKTIDAKCARDNEFLVCRNCDVCQRNGAQPF